jgi:hypothetical protein
MLGQAETEARWQVKEKTKRAKDLITGEGRRRRKAAQEPKDWSRFDLNLLEKKLVERGVMTKKRDGDLEGKRSYSTNFVEIARRCVNDQEREAKKEKTKNAGTETVNM